MKEAFAPIGNERPHYYNSPRARPARKSKLYASNNTDCSCNHEHSSLHPPSGSPCRCCYHDSDHHRNSSARLLPPGILYFLRAGRWSPPISPQPHCFSHRHGRLSYRRHLRAVGHRSQCCEWYEAFQEGRVEYAVVSTYIGWRLGSCTRT